VLSSGAQGALGLRAPADVINLMAVWGLGRERGMEALGVIPRSVVVNEGLKRTSFRGIVNVIEGGEAEDGEEGGKEKEGQARAKEGRQQNKTKRKQDAVEGEEGPQRRERQNKKMRLAASKANENSSTAKEQLTEGSSTLIGPDTLIQTNKEANV